jgi:hypothetical protein
VPGLGPIHGPGGSEYMARLGGPRSLAVVAWESGQ